MITDMPKNEMLYIHYSPSFRLAWFIYESNVFLIRRVPVQVPIGDGGATGLSMPKEYDSEPEGKEPLVVMCLGRSVKPIKNFLETCRRFAEKGKNSEAFLTTYHAKCERNYVQWDIFRLSNRRPIRRLETVHFDENVKDDIVSDIRNYLNPHTRRFYTKRGIPYRRGYLFYGPPGTGKTSLALALAGRFELDLFVCQIPILSGDSDLQALFENLPQRCIVLLEDIDSVGMTRGAKERAQDDSGDSFKKSRCTLSGFLNVLDGVGSREGRVVIMTTNDVHKLDSALIRPGRIDKIVHLGYINQKSAEQLFLRMYAPDDDEPLPYDIELTNGELQKLALEFSNMMPEDTFTPAQLQGYLLNHQTSPIEAVAGTSLWVEEEIASRDDAKRIIDVEVKRRSAFW